ncbi:hypothetical protein H7F15_01235 [Pontibacter sp. Tf4]|uniref:hypothetical protein n=1 Tax=Pontibacter sp. Tf4 TaxID=2761620 RepID=UPI00162A8CD8|nr:hypothetical protein [Pontibacter sp. Tf4]MBB6609650.1 hypothetical protein [Pontibacter sp. Tf4]
MKNFWQLFRLSLPVAAIAMLLSLPCPVALANNNGSAQSVTTATALEADGTKAAAAKSKTKPAAARTRDKSVLDADVLDSPLAYFKEAFTPEDEKSDNEVAPALLSTVKALVATLLSTVL